MIPPRLRRDAPRCGGAFPLVVAAVLAAAAGCGHDADGAAGRTAASSPPHRAPAVGVAPSAQDLSPALLRLLDECAAEIGALDGFESATPIASGPLPCEFRVRDTGLGFEVRASFRPLSRVQVDYDDPHSATPEPDHLHPMLFPALLEAISTVDGVGEEVELTPELAREWGADWAAMSLTMPDPAYATGFPDALFLGLHRNGIADVFVVFLFDAGHPEAKAWTRRALHLVRFREADDGRPIGEEAPVAEDPP